MLIRPVDVFDDALLARYFEIWDAAERFERPLSPRWSLHEMQVELRVRKSAERVEAYAAFDDAEMVGVLAIWFPLLDNVDKVWFQVGVEAERRRRGIGSALVERAVERTSREGRSVMLASCAVPFAERDTHAYLAFARKNGFAVANQEVHRILDLPVDEAYLQGLVDEAATRHTAYRIERFVDGLPADLVASYCYVQNQLAVDAPSGDVDYEAEGMTPQVWQERLDELRESGGHRSTTVAVDAEGDVVAYSDLVIPAGDPLSLHQWGTLVRKDHRGHRLGLAVKARNLLEVQREYPERRSVHTGNAEVNRWMIEINERLGFRPVEIVPELQRKLDPAGARQEMQAAAQAG